MEVLTLECGQRLKVTDELVEEWGELTHSTREESLGSMREIADTFCRSLSDVEKDRAEKVISYLDDFIDVYR